MRQLVGQTPRGAKRCRSVTFEPLLVGFLQFTGLLCCTIRTMSPTVFREGEYRFFFFSREESRVHVHVYSSRGEAKFWMRPQIELAKNSGIPSREITIIARIIEEHADEIMAAWRERFGS